uniref:Fanconi-associated nuclease n=1 Tax=Rhabditophanes sp. KR3021 TaxID=114890 RepID=A0AC35TIE1_9BILA
MRVLRLLFVITDYFSIEMADVKMFAKILNALENCLKKNHETLNVKLFIKIIYNVLLYFDDNGKQAFFKDHLRILSDFSNLQPNEHRFFYRLFSNGNVSCEEDKLVDKDKEKKKLLERMLEMELIENVTYSALSLKDLCTKMNAAQRKIIFTKYKISEPKKTNKRIIQKLILQKGRQKEISGKKLEAAITKDILEILGQHYKVPNNVLSLFSSIFIMHYPNIMDPIHDTEPSEISNYMVKNVVNYISRYHTAAKPNQIRNNSLIALSIFETFDEIAAYNDIIEKYRILKMHNSMSARECREIVLYAKNELSCPDNNLKWIRRRLPSRLYRYCILSVGLHIIAAGARLFEKAKEFEAAECLYKLITHNLLSFVVVSKKEYSEWWARRIINYKRLAPHKSALISFYNETVLFEKDLTKEMLLDINKYYMSAANANLFNIQVSEVPTIEICLESLKNTGDSGVKNQFIIRKPGKEVQYVKVELAALDYLFKNRGFTNGGHYENDIWKELFMLIFGDIVTTQAPNDVPYFHEYLLLPPLLGTKEYMAENGEKYKARCVYLLGSNGIQINKLIVENLSLFNSFCTKEDYKPIFETSSLVMDFLNCVKLEGLLKVLMHRLEFYEGKFSGFPDLLMWNTNTREIAGFEVKGPGDTLKSKQKLVISLLNKNIGLNCYVLKIKANTII